MVLERRAEKAITGTASMSFEFRAEDPEGGVVWYDVYEQRQDGSNAHRVNEGGDLGELEKEDTRSYNQARNFKLKYLNLIQILDFLQFERERGLSDLLYMHYSVVPSVGTVPCTLVPPA